ncbi:MAG: hypothetical protein JWM99_4964 [Verrucomicrobiales bacterium]|nr:hypothetical protein [Verrucomicrobiales bacterium]
MKIVLSVLLICVAAVTTAAADKPFAGTFANEELTVKIVATDDAYSGEFKLAGQTFPLTAQASENTLRGKFKNEEGTFEFTASLNENILTVKTDDTTYKLTRHATNPLARKPSPLTKKEESSSTSTNALSAVPAWKVYKHPTGLSMSYPPDWQLKPFPQGLQLIPPDAGSNEKGPTEAYLVFAESAEGISTAEDPRVLAYIETQLLQVAPFFRRSGEVEKISAGTAPGIFVIWDGTNPDGMKVQAQALSTILKGYGISVVALGETARIKSREKTIRTIFASFAAGAAEKDPQLIGSWKFWSYSASADGKFGTERSRFMTLQSDGTALWKGRSESIGSVSGRDYLGNETFSGGVAGQNGSSDRGFWSAGDGKLYVRWQDGSTGEWSYRLGGVPGNRRLFLQAADQKKPDEWVQAGP